MYKLLAVIFVINCVINPRVCQPAQPLLSQECLGCICHASTQCNATVGCSGGVCGAFQITKPYWGDTNKPTVNRQDPNSTQAFENCANDLICAAATVQNYMQEYKQDCNLDGIIDCNDYLALHYLGAGDDCRGELPNDYINPYMQCKQHAGGEFLG